MVELQTSRVESRTSGAEKALVNEGREYFRGCMFKASEVNEKRESFDLEETVEELHNGNSVAESDEEEIAMDFPLFLSLTFRLQFLRGLSKCKFQGKETYIKIEILHINPTKERFGYE